MRLPSSPSGPRKAVLDELDVAALGIVEAPRAAERFRRRQPRRAGGYARLDPRLRLVGELVAVRPEELDSVVGERVVRGGDHHAEIGPERAGEHCHGRRRHRPDQDDVHAHRDEAGRQRGFEQVAREPRVLADDDAVPMVAAQEEAAGRRAHLHHGLGGHRLPVRDTADTVGAEEGARGPARAVVAGAAHRGVLAAAEAGSRMPRQSASACRVSATSCTRRICAPSPSACSPAASEPGNRSLGASPALRRPMKLLRETPASSGQPRPWKSAQSRRISRLWRAVLPKPDAGIDDELLARESGRLGRANVRCERVEDVEARVDVARLPLHRLRRPPHVNEHGPRTMPGDDRAGPAVVAERADVVHDAGAGRERGVHHRGAAGVDGNENPGPGERAHHRQHPAHLLFLAWRPRTGAGRFAAHVDDVRAGLGHGSAVRDRIPLGGMVAAVGEAVGRHVEDAHQPRPVERKPADRAARRGEAGVESGDVVCDARGVLLGPAGEHGMLQPHAPALGPAAEQHVHQVEGERGAGGRVAGPEVDGAFARLRLGAFLGRRRLS